MEYEPKIQKCIHKAFKNIEEKFSNIPDLHKIKTECVQYPLELLKFLQYVFQFIEDNKHMKSEDIVEGIKRDDSNNDNRFVQRFKEYAKSYTGNMMLTQTPNSQMALLIIIILFLMDICQELNIPKIKNDDNNNDNLSHVLPLLKIIDLHLRVK